MRTPVDVLCVVPVSYGYNMFTGLKNTGIIFWVAQWVPRKNYFLKSTTGVIRHADGYVGFVLVSLEGSSVLHWGGLLLTGTLLTKQCACRVVSCHYWPQPCCCSSYLRQIQNSRVCSLSRRSRDIFIYLLSFCALSFCRIRDGCAWCLRVWYHIGRFFGVPYLGLSWRWRGGIVFG